MEDFTVRIARPFIEGANTKHAKAYPTWTVQKGNVRLDQVANKVRIVLEGGDTIVFTQTPTFIIEYESDLPGTLNYDGRQCWFVDENDQTVFVAMCWPI